VVAEDEEHPEVVHEVAVELLVASAAEVVVQVLLEVVAVSHEEGSELVEALAVASVDVVKIFFRKLLTSVLFLVLFSIWRWGNRLRILFNYYGCCKYLEICSHRLKKDAVNYYFICETGSSKSSEFVILHKPHDLVNFFSTLWLGRCKLIKQ
jgi:hypothetical protein